MARRSNCSVTAQVTTSCSCLRFLRPAAADFQLCGCCVGTRVPQRHTGGYAPTSECLMCDRDDASMGSIYLGVGRGHSPRFELIVDIRAFYTKPPTLTVSERFSRVQWITRSGRLEFEVYVFPWYKSSALSTWAGMDPNSLWEKLTFFFVKGPLYSALIRFLTCDRLSVQHRQ